MFAASHSLRVPGDAMPMFYDKEALDEMVRANRMEEGRLAREEANLQRRLADAEKSLSVLRSKRRDLTTADAIRAVVISCRASAIASKHRRGNPDEQSGHRRPQGRVQDNAVGVSIDSVSTFSLHAHREPLCAADVPESMCLCVRHRQDCCKVKACVFVHHSTATINTTAGGASRIMDDYNSI